MVVGLLVMFSDGGGDYLGLVLMVVVFLLIRFCSMILNVIFE